MSEILTPEQVSISREFAETHRERFHAAICDSHEALRAKLIEVERELAHWKICENCGTPLTGPGICDNAISEREKGLELMHEETLTRAIEAESKLAKVERERDSLELTQRRILWLDHGCSPSVLYGDDGEMQCGAHARPLDFKRQPIDYLVTESARLKMANRQCAEAQLAAIHADCARLVTERNEAWRLWNERAGQLAALSAGVREVRQWAEGELAAVRQVSSESALQNVAHYAIGMEAAYTAVLARLPADTGTGTTQQDPHRETTKELLELAASIRWLKNPNPTDNMARGYNNGLETAAKLVCVAPPADAPPAGAGTEEP